MENATKALLIAASVLMAILLIGLGIKIFSSTEGTEDATDQTMETVEVSMFNKQFTKYLEKDKLTVIEARELQQLINSSNSLSSHNINCEIIYGTEYGGIPYESFTVGFNSSIVSYCTTTYTKDTEGYIETIKIKCHK